MDSAVFDCLLTLGAQKTRQQVIEVDLQEVLRLWISQEGLCPECGHKITRTTGWRCHKIIWRVFWGSDSMSNRVLLYPRCDGKVHDRELEVVNPRLVTEALK